MNDDEKFDRWIAEAARGYNPPPDVVPRDAMWEAVRRGQATAAGSTVEGSGAVVRIGGARGVTGRWWQAAAAAVLLVGLGIGIGRNLPSGTTAVGSPRVAAVAGGDSTVVPQPQPSASYDVAATQHLASAEALLTSFRREGTLAEGPALEGWARDLLLDTRLLLDSPAAKDVARRHLLEDLELILAQIVQLPAESSADRSLVHRSIDRGEVLSRIRTSIPAGVASGT